jgi:EAL domain-containing protein (putative c-di-GMP-specific phosphodiesterase class I)
MRYGGIVQLMSGAKSALLDDVHRIGALRGLNMCLPLQKPFRADAIRQALASVPLWDRPEITISLAPAIEPRLEEAIANAWLELWYQPQIDLRTRSIAGVEAIIVTRHPVQGVSLIEGLLPQASPTTRAALAERFLAQALHDWSDLARAGLGSRVAIAASFDALANGNLMELARRQRPKSDLWPGLILEIGEHEVIQDINLAHEIATQLRIHDITLGIDNFGAGFSSFERLRELPFSELKLHPGFVAGCGRDDKNAGICRAAIDLAHRFGIVAVADGLESEADMRALQGMGCDVGQGPLLAEPMPKSELMDVFGERARTKHAWIG